MTTINQEYIQVAVPLLQMPVFDYSVPVDTTLEVGQLVEVSVRNKRIVGIVWSKDPPTAPLDKIKPITSKLDLPPFKTDTLQFVKWMADYTINPIGNLIKMLIPLQSVFKSLPDEKYYGLGNADNVKVTSERQKVINCLNEDSPVTTKEIKEKTGVSSAIINAMIDKNILVPKPKIIKQPDYNFSLPELSSSQQQIVEQLKSKIDKQQYDVTLLEGVTGSGKTEVYFSLIADILTNTDKQVLIMLPEIALTTQLVDRFIKRFGFKPSIWNSSVTEKQKRMAWMDVMAGRSRLVIGARSALFMAFRNLALIVVDEEHDATYKQEDGVIYHARDMAVARGYHENCAVILASATPSLETIQNCQSRKYDKLLLTNRFSEVSLPVIKIADMRKSSPGKSMWLSELLRGELIKNFNRKKQSLLFLNRRGYAPLTLCSCCGYRFTCPNCSAWLVEHRSKARLCCHHCGYNSVISETCPDCGKEESFVACGPGVERIKEEVENLIKEARVAVVTRDTVDDAVKAKIIIDAIITKQIDVIVGTQMIAKGHHFPDLTLVGVVDADIGLAGGDLRAAERSYQLLQQVSGRAGREEERGIAIIQTYNKDNAIMRALANGEQEEFIACELNAREQGEMPPFVRLASIIVSGIDEDQVRLFSINLVKLAPQTKEFVILGPAPALMSKLRGQYRYRILVKCSKQRNIQKFICGWIFAIKRNSNIKIKIDIDPYNFF